MQGAHNTPKDWVRFPLGAPRGIGEIGNHTTLKTSRAVPLPVRVRHPALVGEFTFLPNSYNSVELGGDGFSEPWPLSDSPKSLTENATLRLGSH